ncbi:MAG TPA: thioester domain-containing protein [Actinophytocola sp.]|jgi:TQXA domain-containing protein|nr:thioester domain-containing protein [Actinophytocola sp.]
MARFKLARAGAGVTGAAVLLMMAAAVPATADPVTGTVDDGAQGLNVNVGNGFKSNLSTSLIGLTLDSGKKLGVYCVQIDQGIDRAHPLVEKDWTDYPDAESPFNANRDKINFILHNGFPEKNTGVLTKELTDAGTNLNDGSLSVQEAIAGTQAAIWHFSDATDLDRNEPVPGDARSGQDVLALFDLLTGPGNVGLGDEPDASLKIDPESKQGQAGERIGPFTVTTTGAIDKFATSLPYGVRITDVDGRALKANQIKNASQLFFDVPEDTADGGANFRLTALATVDTGRLFVGQNYDENHKTQTLIVASGERTEVTAKATAEWIAQGQENAPPVPQGRNEDDNGGLASTGASIALPLGIGAGLLVLGGGALLFLRRRRPDADS